MITIYKYLLPTAEVFELSLPKASRFLSLQLQNGQPCMWFLVDDAKPLFSRTFGICGTGNKFPDIGPAQLSEFLGTFQLNGGSLVFHVFSAVE